MSDIVSRFEALRVIPAAAIERAEDAPALADALVAGGLPCLEVVLRTPAGIDAIRQVSRRSGILLGAGTVLTIDQVKAAVDAGAAFMVSPGYNPTVADYCLRQRILHIPGVCTPTEIEAALERGLRLFKFFPAEAMGGVGTLRAIGGPYSRVKFIPTGGINAGNLSRYLRCPKVMACGGTWIAEASLIRRHRFEDIADLARQAVAIANACDTENRIGSAEPGGELP